MADTNLTITGGLPYSRRIRVENAVNIWATLDEFEVRSQVRAGETSTSTLRATLTPYFTASIDGNDIVLDLHMDGATTRTLYGGFYDVILSDIGTFDNRALPILKGKLKVNPLVTGA